MNWSRYLTGLCFLLLTLSPLSACSAREPDAPTVGISITGLDHLAEHLSVQDFWVNGVHAHQAGKGGSKVCCASLPAQWHPGLSVTVKWGVTNWRDHAYSMHERLVQVPRYNAPGRLWVHFMIDGSVLVFSTDIGPGIYEPNIEYPGPQPLTSLPSKSPWKEYKATRPEGMAEFPLVDDAMKDHRK